jgi:hypothetical protein
MKQISILALVVLVVLIGSALAEPVETEHKTVPLDDADAVLALVDFGAGSIDVHPGPSGSLLDATMTYDPEFVDVFLDYRHRGDRGILELASDFDEKRLTRKIKNEWDVGLSSEVPMELELDIGAAEARIDLSGLSITRLELDVGAADCEVWWDKANGSTMTELAIDCGASSLLIEGLGYAGLEYLDFEGGLGSFELDFSGDWLASAEGHLEVGLGQLEITVPRSIGVRIEATESFGSVDVDRWFDEVDRDVYESENYADAKIKLLLEIELGMGSLDVRSTNRDRP